MSWIQIISKLKSIGIFATILIGSLTGNVQAQGSWNASFGLKTNHLWHGFIVTDGAMTSGSMSYTSEDKNTTYGFWGGSSFNGEFKEFTYYVSHQFNENWFIEVVNHGNHSSIDDTEVDIFNYSSDPTKTGNFTDIGLKYTFSGQTPVSIYYSVIVQGIDKFTNEDNEELERSFTNYVEVNTRVWQGKQGETVTAFIAGAFSPVQEENFYHDSAAINNVGLTYRKNINVFDKSIPISTTVMWNPAKNIGAFQFAIDFF